jgi:hypothetical protein
MAQAAREFCYYPLAADGLPVGFTVEHVDHHRTHNCLSNMLLLQTSIHNWCSRATRSYRTRAGRLDGLAEMVATMRRIAKREAEALDPVPF